MWNSEVLYRVYKSPPLVPTLKQIGLQLCVLYILYVFIPQHLTRITHVCIESILVCF